MLLYVALDDTLCQRTRSIQVEERSPQKMAKRKNGSRVGSKNKLTSFSPGKLPKVTGACVLEGARCPPLCCGIWGMGEGECAGDGTRGLLPGIGIGAAPPTWGVLWVIAGDSLNPN